MYKNLFGTRLISIFILLKKCQLMKRLLPLILFMTTPCFAQQRSNSLTHPIDEALEVCLAFTEDQNGEAAIKCYYEAREAWGEEVEKFYELLMKTLPRPEQRKLEYSQLQWVQYRDAEMLFSGAMYRGLEGDMWMIINAQRTTDIVKQRAIELEEYHEMLTFDPE